MGLTSQRTFLRLLCLSLVQASSGRHRSKWQVCGTPRKVGAAGYSTFPDPVGISQKPLEEVWDTKGPREGILSPCLLPVGVCSFRGFHRDHQDGGQSKRHARLALCRESSCPAASTLSIEKPSPLAPAGHGHPLSRLIP